MQVLNNRADEMDLTDIYGVFHLKASKYTLSVHMAYSRGLTTSWAVKQTSVNLSKQLISSTFADHSTMWLEINKKKETVRRGKKEKHKQVEAKHMLLHKEEIKDKIKIKTT